MKNIIFCINKRKVLTAIVAIVGVFALIFSINPAAKTVMKMVSATERKLPIYCVETEEKKVAISFDAAWGADDTDELLRILAENDVKTTFFMCGYWVDDYSEEVLKIFEAGHDLGNHSATHPHMSQLTKEQIKKELTDTHEKVVNLTGYKMELFRPPFGEYDNKTIEAAQETGYHTVQWDVDSLDWKEYGVESQINQVLNHKHLGNGSIILFHNDAKYTPQALDSIIKGLKEKGFEIVPISELIHKDNYYMDHEGRQKLN
ncbi:MAG: polysaccharide deacetylase family protein [Anaerotignaceae bacterium]